MCDGLELGDKLISGCHFHDDGIATHQVLGVLDIPESLDKVQGFPVAVGRNGDYVGIVQEVLLGVCHSLFAGRVRGLFPCGVQEVEHTPINEVVGLVQAFGDFATVFSVVHEGVGDVDIVEIGHSNNPRWLVVYTLNITKYPRVVNSIFVKLLNGVRGVCPSPGTCVRTWGRCASRACCRVRCRI